MCVFIAASLYWGAVFLCVWGTIEEAALDDVDGCGALGILSEDACFHMDASGSGLCGGVDEICV